METDYSYRVNGSWSVGRNGIVAAERVKEPNIPSSVMTFTSEVGHKEEHISEADTEDDPCYCR
jgi:hypothetical protein